LKQELVIVSIEILHFGVQDVLFFFEYLGIFELNILNRSDVPEGADRICVENEFFYSIHLRSNRLNILRDTR
jgi:hypothetical protein